MRKLVSAAGLAGLVIVLAQAGTAVAQGPQSTAYEDNTAQSQPTRLSFSQQNVYERASLAARERQSRMESLKWQGHVPLRPKHRAVTYEELIGHGRGPWDRYYGYHPLYGQVRIW
jgi:hypothetical protein